MEYGREALEIQISTRVTTNKIRRKGMEYFHGKMETYTRAVL